jgi:DNA-binding MarR family transcriptional regulator
MTDQRPIGFWLTLVDRLITDEFAEALEEHGVTRRQWELLQVLSAGSATVAQLDSAISPFLARATEETDAESSVEHLSELIESGWVDSTASGYELTDRGRVAYDKLAEVVEDGRDRAVEGISPDEYSAMTATLERIARNMGWSENRA